MPQLDLTTYSSQIFWFILCFIVLYVAVSGIILPRIAEIIKNRKNIVDADLSAAKSLEDKINQLQSSTENLRKDAAQKYQLKLEEASRSAAKQREKMIEALKEKIDQNIQKSHQQLKDLVAEAEAKSAVAIKNLAQQIEQKLTNV